jgi:hypothetical protein
MIAHIRTLMIRTLFLLIKLITNLCNKWIQCSLNRPSFDLCIRWIIFCSINMCTHFDLCIYIYLYNISKQSREEKKNYDVIYTLDFFFINVKKMILTFW